MADWEVEYDTLALTSDLETVAEMPDNLEGRLLADGSPVVPALLPFDRELLVERGIPTDEVDEADSSQCLLLPRGYLSHLRAGDLIGLRLTDRGIVLQPVDDETRCLPTPPGSARCCTRSSTTASRSSHLSVS
ncbi:hypothetical protein [Fodinicola feengrottensis]|uniref:hypothetical protein n=1 Tax=Fodinicola feengrottensis TaxID=435914 RepID=UPI0013D47F50|nr:hypothetical protein [Fodinicola feengrottensis]